MEREDTSSVTDTELDAEADSISGASNRDRNASLDLESALDRLGLEQAFECLFDRTPSEMGELRGEVLNAGGEVVMS